LSFFFFKGPSEVNDFYVSDFFEVKQGKLFNKLNQINYNNSDNINIHNQNVKMLTNSSVNFNTKTIDSSCLLNYSSTRSIDSNSLLDSNSYIISRVGKNKTMSLLEIEDFDFEKDKIVPGNDFIYLQPRKIILDKLPIFHALVDIALNELIDEKATKMTSKLQYVTVKEISNTKIILPSLEFDEINKNFMKLYENHQRLLKKFNTSKQNLDVFKNNFLKPKL